MADSDKGASAETWHVGFQPRGNGSNFEFVCRCTDWMHREMVELEELLADHEAAQWARQAKEALEELVRACHGGDVAGVVQHSYACRLATSTLLHPALALYPGTPQAEESKP